MQKPQKIDRRHQGMELFGGELREGLCKKDARVVHQDVHAAEALDGGLDRLGGGLLLADVAVDEHQAGRGRQ